MIDKLISLSVRNSGFVLLLTAVAIILGWASFKSLPIDAVPDITNIQVQVNTAVEGLIPEEIERFVTYPIENEMGGIPGVEQIRSITRFGLSQLTIIFEEGTDIYIARQLVSEKLQAIGEKLPNNVQPELGPITTGLGEIYFYSIEARTKSKGPARVKQLMELRALDEWFVQPRLLTVKGIAEINSIGGFEKQFFVQPKLKELSKYGIHLDEIVDAIRNNNRNTGGGYIQQTSEQLLIQASGLVRSIDDIKSIVVKKLPNFKTITIGDISNVELDRELRTGAALIDGEEGVLSTVLMILGENSRTVSINIAKKIDEIRKNLPEWAELKTLYSRSDLVNSTLETLQHNLIFGAILVVLILLILIGNFRVAIITAATIPLSLSCTFVLMKNFDISGNLMSLGALDFGIIIDGAVIVMDNCIRSVTRFYREVGRPLTREEVKERVIKSTIEIRSAAGFGQLIIIIVFLPLFALTGVEAKMFIPMAATFCFALGAAFILSFTTIPALAGLILPKVIRTEKNPFVMRAFERIYTPIISGALKIKYVVLLLGLVAIVLGVVLFIRLGANFLPQLDEGSIAIQFVRPTNVSIEQSVNMQSLSEKQIMKFPEVSRVFSRIGTAEIATDPMGVNISDTYVLLKDSSQWPEVDGRVHDKIELVRRIKKHLEAVIPGQSLIISQPIQLRFNELLEGIRADVSLKVFGNDMDEIIEIARNASVALRSLPGAGDVEEEIRGKSPLLSISPIPAKLHQQGIPKENVLSTVETAIGGTRAGSLFEGVMRFPIIVRLSESDRSSLEAIRRVPVGLDDYLTVPMSEIADIRITNTYSDIRREASKKRAAVMINVRGSDISSFVQKAKKKVESSVKVPPGYYLEWGGSFKNFEKAQERLLIVVPIAMLLVLLMIYMAFQSLGQTLLIALCIPMALLGGVLGLMFNGLDFSISAAVGFIALSGIAVLNGVVLVSCLNRLRVEGLSGTNLILECTKMRLRPVLMTAAGAAFGFLPMMLSTGAGAEVQKPLASVVVGGIISATILTLVVLPTIYHLFERRMRICEKTMSH